MRAQVLHAPAPAAARPLLFEGRPGPEPRPGDNRRAGPPAARLLVFEARPLPEAGRGEIRVAISACGCCRPDLHGVEGDIELRPLPVTPGHQVVGRVDARGPGAERFELGHRVGVTW